MKTIANNRVLATMIMLVITLSGATAQRENRTNKVENDKPGNAAHSNHAKINNTYHTGNYKYRNYNYLPNRYNSHGVSNHAVVISNTGHNVYRERIPQTINPRLTINRPEGFVAMHLDGERYFVNNGRFYRHIPNHGFVLVKQPHHIKILPAGSVKVRVNGTFYFRYQNIYFRWTPFGYNII